MFILKSNREHATGLMNNRNPTKPRDDFMCSETVTSSCSSSDTRRVNISGDKS